ncbi:hypothetical protein COO60DRAFT_1662593 [Scenedesmus sp. NREL 46B-D3]|nr:hypothetical protein COO60DRAFT_1662593 [Scenedesmus sp. NREL 46B-D3]
MHWPHCAVEGKTALYMLNLLARYKEAQWFGAPVDWLDLDNPDYPAIVQHPMDLSTARAKHARRLWREGGEELDSRLPVAEPVAFAQQQMQLYYALHDAETTAASGDLVTGTAEAGSSTREACAVLPQVLRHSAAGRHRVAVEHLDAINQRESEPLLAQAVAAGVPCCCKAAQL